MKGFKIIIQNHSEPGEYVEAERDKISLTNPTPPKTPSRKSLEEKIKDLDDKQRKKLSTMLELL